MKASADASYQLLAARYVRKQLKQLTSQLEGVREGEDIEFVHRARVASRRLRAALRMFGDCFGRKRVKRWRRQIRRLTGDLGDARDKDVQILFVCGILSGLQQTAHYPGIARLLVKLEHQREQIQPQVLKTVDRIQASPVPAEMLETAKSLVKQLGKRGVPVKSDFVLRETEKHILTRLDEMLGYQSCLGDPEDQDGHHAMRIAAKRLRYTMEICKPVYGSRLDESVATVKEVQTLLGEIHDCDVWVEDLQELLEEERQRIVKYYQHSGPLVRLQAGIDYLRQERQEQRLQLLEKLVQYWEEVERIGLWKDLAETVRRRDEVSEPPQPAASAPTARNIERRQAVVRQRPIVGDARSEPRSASLRPAPNVLAERTLEETG
jgi:CHAD domain-containing protein